MGEKQWTEKEQKSVLTMAVNRLDPKQSFVSWNCRKNKIFQDILQYLNIQYAFIFIYLLMYVLMHYVFLKYGIYTLQLDLNQPQSLYL